MGVSTDSGEANAAFAEKYKFPFPLLSDTERKVCMAYGACDSPNATRARRITYVIGPDGKILHVYENVNAESHVETLLASLSEATRPTQQDIFPEAHIKSQVYSGADTTERRKKEMDDQQKEVENVPIQDATNVGPAEATNQPPTPDALTTEHLTKVAAPSPMPSAKAASPGPQSAPFVTPSQVHPAQGNKAPTLVYALGEIGYDFGTEARRDAFVQAMSGSGNPHDPEQLLAHLKAHPYDYSSLIWTLNLDATPIYAIQPAGPFANVAYERLWEFMNGQLNEGIQRVSIPGYVAGKIRLLSGQEVPVVVPEVRGMYSWSTDTLVQAVLGELPQEEAAKAQYEQRRAGVYNFLERVYYGELRNLGLSSQERAMNFAATNAFQITQVFGGAAGEGLEMDTISVEPSPVCRPGSDCWDVKLVFFDPTKRQERARKVYRFTVDVSDVVPVTVGGFRSWSVY